MAGSHTCCDLYCFETFCQMNQNLIESRPSRHGSLPASFYIVLFIVGASGSCRQPDKTPWESTIRIIPKTLEAKEDNFRYNEPEAFYHFSNGMIIRIDTGWRRKHELP